MTTMTVPGASSEAGSEVKAIGAISVAALAATGVLLSVLEVGPFAGLTSWFGIGFMWAEKIFDILTGWQAFLISSVLMACGAGIGVATVRAFVAQAIKQVGKKAAKKMVTSY